MNYTASNSKNRAYKQTEIGEIPDDWEVTSLGGTARLNYGKSLPKISRSEGGVPVYGSSGITGFNDQALVQQEGYIIGRKGTIGTVYYSPKPFYPIDTTYFVTKDDINCDFKYFYYLLKYLNLDKLNYDSAVPGLNRDVAYRQKYAIPISLTRQQQVASILSSLDDKIELNRKMNMALEEIGKTLFKRWFVDFIFPDNDRQHKEVELKDFVDINPKEELRKGGTARYVEMKDLPEQGMWVYSKINKPFRGGSKFRNGDTLMARITPCLENGKSAFVNFLDEEELAFGSTEFIVLRPKNEVFKEYIYFLVREEEFRCCAIKSMIGSSGRQRVQTDAIQHYHLSFPSIDLVGRFHTLMEPTFQQIRTNAIENIKLIAVRDSLLPRLMSGKLRTN